MGAIDFCACLCAPSVIDKDDICDNPQQSFTPTAPPPPPPPPNPKYKLSSYSVTLHFPHVKHINNIVNVFEFLADVREKKTDK